jgi:hypothetical protein
MDEYCGAGTENHPLGFRANRMNQIRINFPVNDIDWRDLRVLIKAFQRCLPGAYPSGGQGEPYQSKPLIRLAHPTRFERVTFAFGGQWSWC